MLQFKPWAGWGQVAHRPRVKSLAILGATELAGRANIHSHGWGWDPHSEALGMVALRESWAVSGVGSWQTHERGWSCLVQGGDVQPGGGELCRLLGEKGACPLGLNCHVSPYHQTECVRHWVLLSTWGRAISRAGGLEAQARISQTSSGRMETVPFPCNRARPAPQRSMASFAPMSLP